MSVRVCLCAVLMYMCVFMSALMRVFARVRVCIDAQRPWPCPDDLVTFRQEMSGLQQLLCLALTWSLSTAFLTLSCPAPAPCQCDVSIHCEARQLNVIPRSLGLPGTEPYIGLYLNRNNITVVDQDSLKVR